MHILKEINQISVPGMGYHFSSYWPGRSHGPRPQALQVLPLFLVALQTLLLKTVHLTHRTWRKGVAIRIQSLVSVIDCIGSFLYFSYPLLRGYREAYQSLEP